MASSLQLLWCVLAFRLTFTIHLSTAVIRVTKSIPPPTPRTYTPTTIIQRRGMVISLVFNIHPNRPSFAPAFFEVWRGQLIKPNFLCLSKLVRELIGSYTCFLNVQKQFCERAELNEIFMKLFKFLFVNFLINLKKLLFLEVRLLSRGFKSYLWSCSYRLTIFRDCILSISFTPFSWTFIRRLNKSFVLYYS